LVFIDSNIPMYLIGEDHPNKEAALWILESLTRNNTRLVTNSETFQEILHRYSHIKKTEAIQPAWEVLENLCDEVFTISFEDVLEAKNLLLSHPALSSRDCLHIANIKRHKVQTLFSFDKGFDSYVGLHRIP